MPDDAPQLALSATVRLIVTRGGRILGGEDGHDGIIAQHHVRDTPVQLYRGGFARVTVGLRYYDGSPPVVISLPDLPDWAQPMRDAVIAYACALPRPRYVQSPAPPPDRRPPSLRPGTWLQNPGQRLLAVPRGHPADAGVRPHAEPPAPHTRRHAVRAVQTGARDMTDVEIMRRCRQISRERALSGIEILSLIQAGERVVAELDQTEPTRCRVVDTSSSDSRTLGRRGTYIAGRSPCESCPPETEAP